MQEKAYEYICPACKGKVTSKVRTGQVNHQNVCGNRFSVKDGVVKEKGKAQKEQKDNASKKV